jgi:hypothetical protein
VLASALAVVAVGFSVLGTAGCAPASFGDTANLGISEAWSSNGSAAHDHAALIVVRVDGRVIFRQFTALSEKRTYSADDTGHYTITGAVYRCSGACRAGSEPHPGDHKVAHCSFQTEFDGGHPMDYVFVVRTRHPACQVGADNG